MIRPVEGPTICHLWAVVIHHLAAIFSFLYLKKSKFQKYMSVLKIFKNTPRSPYGGRQALDVNFFSSNLQRGPWPKKNERGPVAPPNGRQGPVAHPRGDKVPPPYI